MLKFGAAELAVDTRTCDIPNARRQSHRISGETGSSQARVHGEDDRLLTIEEVADILRIPVATLRYWRHRGIGPDSLRIGRRVLYWLSDVYRWLQEQSDGDSPGVA